MMVLMIVLMVKMKVAMLMTAQSCMSKPILPTTGIAALVIMQILCSPFTMGLKMLIMLNLNSETRLLIPC